MASAGRNGLWLRLGSATLAESNKPNADGLGAIDVRFARRHRSSCSRLAVMMSESPSSPTLCPVGVCKRVAKEVRPWTAHRSW